MIDKITDLRVVMKISPTGFA